MYSVQCLLTPPVVICIVMLSVSNVRILVTIQSRDLTSITYVFSLRLAFVKILSNDEDDDEVYQVDDDGDEQRIPYRSAAPPP